MNTLIFEVYKNTLKKTDGFNPVSSENKYSQIKLNFKGGDDWERCSVITASFFGKAIDDTYSVPAVIENGSATIKLPSEVLKGTNRVQLGLSGIYDNDGESTNIATNIVAININKGIIINDGVNASLYENILNLFKPSVVDIRKFGAKANNESFDNANAIMSAVKYAQNCKGMVYIPPNKYYINSTISINNIENITIINDGIIAVKSKELREGTKLTTAFAFKQSKNVYFSAGRIESVRDKEGKAPADHTRENYSSSNIIGVHINECNNITATNYTVDGLEYGFVIDADDGVYSNDIKLKNFKGYNTSQPVYGSHFKNFRIENMYCEACKNCGSGDHFVYISKYSKNFTIDKAELIYTDKFYGPALNLRSAYTEAKFDGVETKDTYDDTLDLDVAHISNVTIKECIWFVTAKAKTKVYIDNCNIESTELEKKPCLHIMEYAEMYITNSKIYTKGDLFLLPNKTYTTVTFDCSNIKCDKMISGGAAASDRAEWEKNIRFTNCKIECYSSSSPMLWLNWGCNTDVVFVHSSLKISYAYAFYVGNEKINYKAIGCVINGVSVLVYYNSSTYTPTTNVQVKDCLCYGIKKICSAEGILNSGNVLCYYENDKLVVKDIDKDLLGDKANTADDIAFSDEETFQQKYDSGELKGQQGERGEKGQDGKNGVDGTNGKDGIGISKSEINTSGELVITYSDGSTANVGVVVGAKGDKGDKGDTGATGADGIGITSTEINESGELVLTYSDGSTANVGTVVGNDYVLTDTDKTDIANIVINEYDSSVMAILGGDSSVTE